MPKYIVEVSRHYDYEVPVFAKDEDEARELVRDYEIEDLEPYQTNAYFDFDFGYQVED
jgi:hypothetical protein